MEFDKLISSIQSTHEELQLSAVKAVNQSLTLRNWLIGPYIVEFEQNGEDRARYGEGLLSEPANSIKIKGLSVTNLRLCRQFYAIYPHLLPAVKENLANISSKEFELVRHCLSNYKTLTTRTLQFIRQCLMNYNCT